VEVYKELLELIH